VVDDGAAVIDDGSSNWCGHSFVTCSRRTSGPLWRFRGVELSGNQRENDEKRSTDFSGTTTGDTSGGASQYPR
jgi:hypothetical protein